MTRQRSLVLVQDFDCPVCEDERIVRWATCGVGPRGGGVIACPACVPTLFHPRIRIVDQTPKGAA